jgi:hypothetical protein
LSHHHVPLPFQTVHALGLLCGWQPLSLMLIRLLSSDLRTAFLRCHPSPHMKLSVSDVLNHFIQWLPVAEL